MTREKLDKILESMKGISYFDWQKLKMSIDSQFKVEIGQKERELSLTDTEIVVREMKHYSTTI